MSAYNYSDGDFIAQKYVYVGVVTRELFYVVFSYNNKELQLLLSCNLQLYK